MATVGTGCVTTQDTSGPAPASRADVVYLQEEIRRLNARVLTSDEELGRLHAQMASAGASDPGYASADQTQAMQLQIDDLQRQIRALDAARVQDKKELYEDIANKVASLMQSAAPRGGTTRKSGGAQTGIEHVVQPGESLSRIATAYKVRMSSIVEANDLKTPDNIRVGQKLFIPD